MLRKVIIASIPGASDRISEKLSTAAFNLDTSRLNYEWMEAFNDPEYPTLYSDLVKGAFYDHGAYNKVKYIFIPIDVKLLRDLAEEGIPFTIVVPNSRQSATIQLCENQIHDELMIKTIEDLDDIISDISGMNVCRSDIPLEVLIEDDDFRARYI